MKRWKKKLAVMATMMMMVFSMAITAFAAKTKMISTGWYGYGRGEENTTYCTYVKTTALKKTVVLKQKKGTLYYKKANGKKTTRSSYAKLKVVIRENNDKGKVVAQTTWNSGTLKIKGKAKKTYYLEVTYMDPVSGKILVGPLYRQGWKNTVYWEAKAALF